MRFKRKQLESLAICHGGLTTNEIDILATYNSEVERGLVHTDSWVRQMIALQARYDLPPRELLGPDDSDAPRTPLALPAVTPGVTTEPKEATP